MIKSFRRSKRQSNNNDSPKRNISRVGSYESSTKIGDLQSPTKVIKALYDYTSQGPSELGFHTGDFFHVLDDDETKHNGWYEATNPMTNQKGMVPASYFEVFNRSKPLGSTEPINNTSSNQRNSNPTLYAVTLFEFKAEREDELDVMPGENLIICAHHDYEWFIAKPINRLGGPGLVPVSYVRIIDLVNPSKSQSLDENPQEIIKSLKIPTVELWKDQTARYQASTIQLGTISSQQTAVSSNTQYFERNSNNSNRSSLSSSNTSIIEASVDSYQLDNGRYQYLVTAKLSNGKSRYLYRYYQDFYDLQVKLLELFPFEAGKIENSKRIIPSIPGPLINVNDSISKLRREKLDYYLRNLIALPLHISRSEEVLRLFDVLDNGFDKEVIDETRKRSLKPINQQSNYQQDRLSQYSVLHYTSNNGTSSRLSSTPTSSESSHTRSRSSSTTNLMHGALGASAPLNEPKQSKVKVKFYFEDDIFVLLLPTNLRLQDLKSKLLKRLNLEENLGNQVSDLQLYLKNDYDEIIEEEYESDNLNENAIMKLKPLEINDDVKFQDVIYDKCKLVILV